MESKKRRRSANDNDAAAVAAAKAEADAEAEAEAEADKEEESEQQTAMALRKQLQRSADTDDVETRSRIIREAMSKMSEEEVTRFEVFTRSRFPRNVIKAVLMQAVGFDSSSSDKNPINDEMVAVVASLAKLFVGDLVETAKIIQEERGESGGITKEQLIHAYGRLQRAGIVPSNTEQMCAFIGSSTKSEVPSSSPL